MMKAALLPGALLLANVAALILSLVAPRILSPAEYAAFTLSLGLGQLTVSVVFEWLRLSLLRYGYGSDVALSTARRRVMRTIYIGLALILLVVAIAAGALSIRLPWAVYIAVVAFYAILQAVFDANQAVSRATFSNVSFALSLILRTFLSLVFFSIAAWITKKGHLALIALALSYPTAAIVVRKGWGSSKGGLIIDWNQARFLLAYGGMAAGTTIISSLLPTAMRSTAVSYMGLAESGGFLLAVDMSQKAVAVVGLAANVVHTQDLFKAKDFGSSDESRQKSRNHVGWIAALLAPTAVGFYVLQDIFIALAIPGSYHRSYAAGIGFGILASALLYFRAFAVDPLFYAAGKSSGALWGSVASVAALLIAALGLPLLHAVNLTTLSLSYVLSTLAGLAAALVMLRREAVGVWPWADFAKIAAACSGMAMVSFLPIWPHSLIGLVVKLAACGLTYLVAFYGLNICGARKLVAKFTKR
jgi:O-antigen/teichoic acid export membrane protein